MFGAVLGYKGYNQMTKEEDLPEFYERLKKLKVGIEPKEGSRGSFSKKFKYLIIQLVMLRKNKVVT